MNNARFVLSKKKLLEKLNFLENLGLKISYSYKTNKEVGKLLQEISNVDFSIHSQEEINEIKNKEKIWFFVQAEDKRKLEDLLKKGVKTFVIDNKLDLNNLLEIISEKNFKINLSLRMKFSEHRIGSGKYFVYGMSSNEVNKIIKNIRNNKNIDKLGISIHRKSQNISEWEIKREIEDSLDKKILEKISFINLGGGLPSEYRSFNSKVFDYIFEKISEIKNFLDKNKIEVWIEPGRFLAAPCIKLETEIVQIQGNNLILNTTIYNCALDTLLTGTKMLIEGELEDEEFGSYFLIKGNSPTRDDIFRYKVKLKNPKLGDKIIFLNAGAYNYSTDFFGYRKLKTDIVDDF
jgi:ornithine decarboxylase